MTIPVRHTVAHARLAYNEGGELRHARTLYVRDETTSRAATLSAGGDRSPTPPAGSTIAVMPVHVDETLPLHPLSVADVEAMVGAGILDEKNHVELLDGVLVEMNPQGSPHAYAIRELATLAFPVVATAGLRLSIQAPLDVGSPISLPEPDLAIVPITGRDDHPRNALLVVEMGATSLSIDLVRKARIYATGGVPEYWVLDVKRRALIVHREPVDGCYTDIRTLGEHETVTAVAVDLTVPVASLL